MFMCRCEGQLVRDERVERNRRRGLCECRLRSSMIDSDWAWYSSRGRFGLSISTWRSRGGESMVDIGQNLRVVQ